MLLRLRCQSCACERLGVFAQMETHDSHDSHDWIWMTHGRNLHESTPVSVPSNTRSSRGSQDLCVKTIATAEIIRTIWNSWQWFKRSDLQARVVEVVLMFWNALAVSADPKNRLCRPYMSSSVESKLSPMSYAGYDLWTSLKYLPGNYPMDPRPLALPADWFGAALASLFSWMQLNYIQSWNTASASCEALFFSDNIHIQSLPSIRNPRPGCGTPLCAEPLLHPEGLPQSQCVPFFGYFLQRTLPQYTYAYIYI